MSVDLIQLLKTIPDPEIPVIDIVELGIVREAKMLDERRAKVVILLLLIRRVLRCLI